MEQTKRIHILELCSEDAYNSWTFWSSHNKTDAEGVEIVKTIDTLIREKKLVTLEKNPDASFVEIPFDIDRLEKEVKESMVSHYGSDMVYWFATTDEGKKEYDAWAKEYWTPERVTEQKAQWKAQFGKNL